MKLIEILFRIMCIIAGLTVVIILIETSNYLIAEEIMTFPNEFIRYLYHAGVGFAMFIIATMIGGWGGDK